MTVDGSCKSQESHLTLIYTLGVFAVSFGLAIVGPFLDALGPQLVSTVRLLILPKSPNLIPWVS